MAFIKCHPILVICAIAALSSSAHGRMSSSEAIKFCASHTGLNQNDIIKHHLRNSDCAVDCITKQGTLMSYFVDDGSKCNYEEPGYVCLSGKCSGPESPRVDTTGLYSAEISIKSAHVPDMDAGPWQGASDTFVVVELEREGKPNYEDGRILCHTYVIQDTNHPRWNNFSCKPMPLRGSAILKFTAFDSDKPLPELDRLGYVTESVENLLNKGPRTLKLINGESKGHYHVEVEIKGKEYQLE